MTDNTANSPLNLLSEYPAWSLSGADDAAVVLSTRVRIARNLKNEAFPGRMDTEGRIRVMRQTARVIAALPDSAQGVFFSLAALTPIELAVLIERRAISPQLARDEKPRGVFAWKEQDRAIMICEEDHVRVTEIVPGLDPEQAWNNAQPVLVELEKHFEFVRDESLGYLTACPANLGAAVRTSLFCHLPALATVGGLEALASHVADAGFTIRGFWGEGSDVLGNTFQFTDGPGLSINVSDQLSRIAILGQEIREREAIARIELQSQRPALLKDKIARALAVLQVCRALSGGESMALLSTARLGMDIGFIEDIDRKTISMLTYELGQGHLKWRGYDGSQPDGRLIRRAELARAAFQPARFVG